MEDYKFVCLVRMEINIRKCNILIFWLNYERKIYVLLFLIILKLMRMVLNLLKDN